jgi:hypothetical protein
MMITSCRLAMIADTEKAPLEAKGQVDDDADDHQQQRQGAVLGQFPADLRANEFDPAQRGARRFGGQGLHHRLADPGRVLLGLERQADQTSWLEPKFCTEKSL